MDISSLITRVNEKTDLPIFEIELILSFVLKKSREFLIAHGEKELTKTQINNFKSLIYRREKGEPIAYIIGHKEFFGLDFIVNKNVLIPRPETELLVEEALKLISHNSQPVTLIDVGTGSGCIIISMAKHFSKLLITNYQLLATDISNKALVIAKKNAKINKINNIKFIQGDLLKPIINNQKLIIRNCRLLIACNLPYLTPEQIKNSPSIKHEPKIALTAGPEGLKYYKKLFKQIKLMGNLTVLCEIDPGQTSNIKRLIKQHLGQASCQIKKDLSGLNRLVIINT